MRSRRWATRCENEQEGGTARRASITAHRDRPGHYRTIIEFDSYDAAWANSALPETSAFPSAMAALCYGPPTFSNLDVLDSWAAS